MKTIGAMLWAGLTVGFVQLASAATVTNIASTITNAPYPPSPACTAIDSCAESYSITGQGGVNQSENVPPQAAFGFTDSFNQASNISTGSNLGASATCGALGCSAWNFQDNILFSTNGASVQAQASATLSNVTDLQARIIELDSLDVYTNSNANAQTLLGGAAVVTVADGWTNFANPILGIDYTGTLPTALSAGSYVLQIRGEAASAGSAYSGTITFTPVPLPTALPLLLCGLSGLAALSRRRRPVQG